MDTEILVVGAGVYGLSIARAARRRGHEVLVAECDRVGSGASATPLGMLAPHSPDRWNDMKALQLQALTAMPDHIAALESETGLDAGYRRAGRLIPLLSAEARALWESRAQDAEAHWQGAARIEIVEPDPGWIALDAAPHGAAYCGLSADLDTRAYLAALAASLGEERVRTGLDLMRAEARVALFASGERIAARQIVIATGVDAFGHLTDPGAGRGEKGQAGILLLPKPLPTGLPPIYAAGVYVVPKGPKNVAVGATSERDYTDPAATDSQLDDLVAQAQAICPALEGALLIERWAGVRPRALDRKPLVRQRRDGVIVATGGFKTGLATARAVAEEVADLL